MKKGNIHSVGFISLGCPKALVDTEQIANLLVSEDIKITPSFQEADLVVVNTCGFIDAAVKDLSIIAGQKAVATMSKKDVSNFKLRKGMPIGTKVTLRGERMYEFLDRLIAVSLPRTRDFKGVKAKGFDGRGNFTFGVKEHIIFPEIDIDKVNKILGMDITFVTSANTDEEAKALLEAFGFPFTK